MFVNAGAHYVAVDFIAIKEAEIARAGVNLDLVYVATRNRVVFGAPDLGALRDALGVSG